MRPSTPRTGFLRPAPGETDPPVARPRPGPPTGGGTETVPVPVTTLPDPKFDPFDCWRVIGCCCCCCNPGLDRVTTLLGALGPFRGVVLSVTDVEEEFLLKGIPAVICKFGGAELFKVLLVGVEGALCGVCVVASEVVVAGGEDEAASIDSINPGAPTATPRESSDKVDSSSSCTKAARSLTSQGSSCSVSISPNLKENFRYFNQFFQVVLREICECQR